MPQHFTLEDFNAALTQLPEYGGYEALSGALGQQFPDARFVPNYSGQGINSTNWEPTGNVGQWFPLDAGRIQSTTNPNRLASYEAMYPALTSLINPQRNVGKASGYVSNDARDADYVSPAVADKTGSYYQGTGVTTGINESAVGGTQHYDERGKNNVVGIGGQAATGADATIGGGAVSNLRNRPMEDYVGEVFTGGVGAANQQGGVVESSTGEAAVEQLLKDEKAREIENEAEEAAKANRTSTGTTTNTGQNFIGDGDEISGLDVSGQTDAERAVALKNIAEIEADIDTFLENNRVVEGSLGQQPTVEDFQANKPAVVEKNRLARTPFIDQPARAGQTSNITTSDTRITGDAFPVGEPEFVESTTPIDNKNLETVNNDIDSYLETKGWSDSGDWGYARTRNMLTGGGLGGVVTEGALVPWQSMGQDASSRDYISNVGDIDRFPSSASSTDISATVPNAEEKADVERVHRAGIGFSADAIASYGSDNTFDITGASLLPESTGRTETGGIYFKSAKDLAEWGSGITSATGIKDIQRRFNYKVFDPDGKFLGIGNKLADAAKDLTKFAQDTFAFMGDPSKKPGDDPTPIIESMDALRSELTQFWQTDPKNLWGRKLFKPGETQDYGSLQTYAIVAALLNPPQAFVTLANTVLHDFIYAAKGMFSENANYDGNPVQDFLNGAFHFLGRGIKSVAKNAKKLFGGKAKEGAEGAEGEALEGEDAFMKQLFKEQKDNKLRILWDEHVMMNSSTALITELFAGEGIPVVLYEKGKDFVKAIQHRRRAESERLHNEIMSDMGMLNAGTSGDLFNLRSFMRDYSAEEGHEQFLAALQDAWRKSAKD